MALEPLPEGFRWNWAGETVRIWVPPILRSDSHLYEPVLSRRDAEALAEAVTVREQKRLGAGARRPISRVVLDHDPGFSGEALAKFREKLSVALVEYGHEIALADTTTRSGMAFTPST